MRRHALSWKIFHSSNIVFMNRYQMQTSSVQKKFRSQSSQFLNHHLSWHPYSHKSPFASYFSSDNSTVVSTIPWLLDFLLLLYILFIFSIDIVSPYNASQYHSFERESVKLLPLINPINPSEELIILFHLSRRTNHTCNLMRNLQKPEVKKGGGCWWKRAYWIWSEQLNRDLDEKILAIGHY